MPCCAPGSTSSSPTWPAPTTTRRVVRDLIRRTIDEGAFAIALQPVVDMRDGSVVGVEALSRFPSDVLAGPGAWFAAALEVGLATELELAARPQGVGPAARPPGRNDAGRQRLSRNGARWPDRCRCPTCAWTRVVLELTEHVPVEDYTALNAALAPLRAAGARIAVDDTGSGFASLRHILDLHPDIIKIDIAITRGIDTDPSRAAMAGMLAQLRGGGGHRRHRRGGRDGGPARAAARARGRPRPGRPPRAPSSR